ncbi:MAG TPA: HlyD family secretion protein [Hyphomicrobium sp.]|nr:HlyD family secretion protein [Hyphomicrobium sp.]
MDQRSPKDASARDERDEKEHEDEPIRFGEIIRAHLWLTAIAVAILIATAAGILLWWLNARHYEWTDDAFIDARQFAVSSKVAGYVQDVEVTDNQRVSAGNLLVQIDPRDYLASLAQAKARVTQAIATVGNDDAQIASQVAQVAATEEQQREADAALVFAKQEYDRAQTLVKSAVGTVERAQQTQSQLQQAQATTSRARANVESAKKQLAALRAQKVSSEANVEAAKADEALAALNLSYTHVTAVQPGKIVQLTAAKGEYVQVGQNLMMFVPSHIWVTANFKETQITDMRPGQPVSIEIDAYPNREFKGHVDSIQAGSGTAFSLLPAENATGNYVKVVQRVPVKIEIDNPPSDVTLGPGMSVVPEVKVR